MKLSDYFDIKCKNCGSSDGIDLHVNWLVYAGIDLAVPLIQCHGCEQDWSVERGTKGKDQESSDEGLEVIEESDS